MSLSGKQRRHLRALGHHLTPIVVVGKGGIDDGVRTALDRALLDHELVKVKLGGNADGDPDAVATDLATGASADVAQVLGATILIYRPHPDAPKIRLPGR
jgi:RNA-binding protein